MKTSQSDKVRPHLSNDQVRTLLQEESHNLFDYLLRMTGQAERSAESTDEVVRVMVKWFGENPDASFKSIRKKFYTTARNFSADIWEADVENLQNSGYDADEEHADEKHLRDFEKRLNKLDALDREIVLLKCRYGFDADTIRELTKLDDDINTSVQKVLDGLERHVNGGKASEAIARLPLHPIPSNPLSSQTQALSELMRNLKSRRGGIWDNPYPVILGGLAVTAIIILVIIVFLG